MYKRADLHLHTTASDGSDKPSELIRKAREEGIELIEKKRQFEQQRLIKSFAENPDVEILNGRYGPYIAMAGKNYKIPTGTAPATLDLAACMEIIEKAAEKPASPRRRKSK